MPEQPPDPLHYDMKIPPEPDPEKQHQPAKPPSDENEREPNDAKDSTTAKDTRAVRGQDKPQSGREPI